MSTIIVKYQSSPQPTKPKMSVLDLHDNEPGKRSIHELLIKVGQKLIEKDMTDKWLTMSQVAAQCRNYRLRWQGSTRARHLESAAQGYFQRSVEIRGNGVKVESMTETNDNGRNLFFVRFRPLLPDCSAAC